MNNKLTLPVVLTATGGKLRTPEKTGSSSNRPPATSEALPGSQSTIDNPGFGQSPVLTLTPDESTLTFEKVVYDSREVSPGSLFVALPGEVTDGHNFISVAVANGASACIVRRDWAEQQSALASNVAWVIVEETLPAFQKLAAYWRNQFNTLTVIGITGSVGKTSTKELMSSVLGQHYQVFKSPKSINTEQSLLPVLLKLQATDQVAVVEMGAGYVFGELERLCAVAQPRIGVVLNVSHSHLGRMKTLDNIARNKSELVRSLPPASEGGVAVLNGDDERVKAMSDLTEARPFFYGTRPEYDLWASDIESFGLEGIAFTAHYQNQAYRLRLPLLGRHSVHTALAVIAVGLLCGVNWQEIETGLADQGAQVRLLVLPGLNGSTIIDDSYNASAVSTVAALDLLSDIRLPEGGRRLAVLGDMLELGTFEEEAHRIVGRRAAQVVDTLLVVGPLAHLAGQEAIQDGLPAEKVIFAAEKSEVVNWLHGHLRRGDYLLIKASRGSHLEEIVEKVRASK
ncbi:MAG TPA: UDP-N-acetylmuramoyl-tripeptide--D-alanyl-D-alanine ligase [Chloroflexia bacterium]|nr:UDP-N-acetylmuramoyl-tripeptide--D-alanyl-D-alanine ligase [Chloroflexia bacterium]